MSIVISLDEPEAGAPCVRLVEPDIPDRCVPISRQARDALEERLRALPTAADKESLIQEIGQEILAILRTHPGIDATVRTRLEVDGAREEPIYLCFEHRMDLESWPWEAMYSNCVGYLSQDRKFAISRARQCNVKHPGASFEPPLRILAILSAGCGDGIHEKISGENQWNSLREGIEASGLKVDLRVLTCQEKLMKSINRKGIRWAKADVIPPVRPAARGRHRHARTNGSLQDPDILLRYIKDYKPHILHVFSHATPAPGPRLQVSTCDDWEASRPGSIIIRGTDLLQHAGLDNNIWLVTLNCCETARPALGTGSLTMSMAAALASEGIPAVVGMREQIAADFADRFSSLFYDALLDDFRSRITKVPKSGGPVDIHWACPLFVIRHPVTPFPEAALEWTLPVMHTALGFQLQVTGKSARTAPPIPRQKAKRLTPLKKPRPPPKPPTARETRELTDERRQLYEDRKQIGAPETVVKRIDRRIAAINRRLARPGEEHA